MSVKVRPLKLHFCCFSSSFDIIIKILFVFFHLNFIRAVEKEIRKVAMSGKARRGKNGCQMMNCHYLSILTVPFCLLIVARKK